MITEEDKRMVVNLAMRIDCGIIPLWAVVETFDTEIEAAREIMKFWNGFNDMTKSVAERVGYEKCREHLENCYRKENKCLMKKIWNAITNGLMTSLFGAAEN